MINHIEFLKAAHLVILKNTKEQTLNNKGNNSKSNAISLKECPLKRLNNLVITATIQTNNENLN